MHVKNLSQNFKQAMAKSVLIATALLVWSLAPTVAQAILATSEPAPSFSLVSGDNKKLSLDMLRGKIVVLFYATRDGACPAGRGPPGSGPRRGWRPDRLSPEDFPLP